MDLLALYLVAAHGLPGSATYVIKELRQCLLSPTEQSPFTRF
jgi:hypothetical protein